MNFFERQKNRNKGSGVRGLNGQTGFTLSKANGQTGFTLSKANGQTGFTLVEGQTGFTLVELLIYMGLLITLIVIFTEIFASITDLQLSSRNTSNVADDGRYIFSRFIYDVNRADSIATPANPGDTTNTLSMVIDGDTYSYSVINGVLSITEPTGTYALSGYGSIIENVSFTRIGDGNESTVRMNFTVRGIVAKQGLSDQQTFQTTAGIR